MNTREYVTLFYVFEALFLVQIWAYSGTGTTASLPEIFIGRCNEFQSLRRPTETKLNCTTLWSYFSSSFASRDPCSVSTHSYEDYLSLFPPIDNGENKFLFWSGVYSLVAHYSDDGKRYLAIRDTFQGFLADSLTWCGQVDSPGIDYTSCPTKSECGEKGQQYYDSFWGAVSSKFAQEAEGVVTLFLNGTGDGRPAFDNKSIFARYELKNFNSQKITELVIVVVQDIGVSNKETCSTGSIPELISMLEEMSLKHRCIETPSPIRHLLCVDSPSSTDCRFENNFKQASGRFGGRRLT